MIPPNSSYKPCVQTLSTLPLYPVACINRTAAHAWVLNRPVDALRNLLGVPDQSQFDHFRLGFLLTVYSLVVDILKHTADSVAAGVAACRLMSSGYSYWVLSQLHMCCSIE